MKLSIVGAGSVRCGVPVLASLATYFGELPLQIMLWDADEERLELFRRLGLICLQSAKSPHEISCTNDVSQALEESEIIMFYVGANCAEKYLTSLQPLPRVLDPVEYSLESIAQQVPKEAKVLSLQKPEHPLPLEGYYRLEWPTGPEPMERFKMPHQMLRWIRGEEYVFDLLKEHENSPLKTWLENPAQAEWIHTSPTS